MYIHILCEEVTCGSSVWLCQWPGTLDDFSMVDESCSQVPPTILGTWVHLVPKSPAIDMCMSVCLYVCLYVSMYACMHACIWYTVYMCEYTCVLMELGGT